MSGYDKNQVHYVVVTGILVKDGKYLIVKRSEKEKAFPGKWTVPGGKVEVLDYILKKKDTSSHWYNVLESNLKREFEEEVSLKITNIGYVTSLVYIRPDEIPCLIISFFAESLDNDAEIKLCSALTEYKWVNLNEAKDYDLIEGIYEEIEILDNFFKKGEKISWERNN